MSEEKKFTFNVGNISKKPPAWMSSATAILGIIYGAKTILLNAPNTSEEMRMLAGNWFDYVFGLLGIFMGILSIVTNDKRISIPSDSEVSQTKD